MHPNDRARLVFDMFSCVLMFTTGVGGAYTAKWLAGPGTQAERALSFQLGNCLSGGVMLSAGFVHLLADAIEDMGDTTYPWACLLSAVGYILTLLADQIVAMHSGGASHAAASRPSDPPPDDPLGACCAGPAVVINAALSTKQMEEPKRGGVEMGGELMARDEEPGSSLLGLDANGGVLRERGATVSAAAGPGGTLSSHLSVEVGGGVGGGGGAWDGHGGHGHGATGRRGGGQARAPQQSSASFDEQQRASLNFWTAVILAVALSIHSVLEGAAMGAQHTMKRTADIMTAILAHKGLASYALGSTLIDTGTDDLRFMTVVVSFASATPIGILVGFVLSEVASGFIAASATALASGTFMYVAFMEVIPKEFKKHKHRGEKLAMLLLGFTLMSLLAVWA